MKWRVLYTVSRLRSGGPSAQLQFIIEHLDRTVFEPSILTLSPEDENTALPQFKEMGVPVSSLSMSRYEGFVHGVERFRKAVLQYGPNLVHTHGLRPDLFSALALQNVNRLNTVHNYPYDDYPMKYGAVRGYPAAWSHLWAFRRLDHLVACSESIKRDLRKHKLNAHVVCNGVDVTAYSPVTVERKRELRRGLGLSLDKSLFISVGSLIARKMPQVVVEGFLRSGVSQRAQLVVLGKGPLRENCEATVQNYPGADVQFVGFVDNVQEYLQAADYFISASLSEGLPYTVLEAMATGLPVALSDIGPHREIVKKGRAGVLFETESADGLASGINQLLDKDIEELGSSARKIICNHFSSEKMSHAYQSLYRDVLNDAGSIRG